MWEIRCDECGRAYDSPVEDLRESKVSALRNGWVVGSLVQCPTCVSADSSQKDREGK